MVRRDNDSSDERPVEIGLGYPRFQLAKALRNSWAVGGGRAERKVEKWQRVLEGMFSGELTVGSRTPVAETPAWVTLEVVTGGFVTGNFLAGGQLEAHEIELASELGIPVGSETRALLNGYYLSDQGQIRLATMTEQGCFRLEVSEEGALLVVAWLLRQGAVATAQSLLDELIPFFDRLRFFPRPSEPQAGDGEQVFLQDVGQTVDALRRVRSQERFEKQLEVIRIWTPLYDRVVALLLETVESELPSVRLDGSGKPVRDKRGRYRVGGGQPCRARPSDWEQRAKALLEAYRDTVTRHQPPRRWRDENKPFQRLLRAVESHALGTEISDRERNYLRLALARYIAKRGVPDSTIQRALREAQEQQCSGPRYHEIAEILAARLDGLPQREGLQDLSAGREPIGVDEATGTVMDGTPIPRHLARKIGRAQVATVQELVRAGYITSADVLASVLPQITSEVRAAGIGDRDLRRVYGHIYRAFRRRRSLLLINLESQVKLEELPWIAVLESYRQASIADRELAGTVMTDVVAMALTHFPHAILPNKLVQELHGLAKQARLDMPLVDEVAADIFMGRFSAKFAVAARVAGALLVGTLYERYYGIDYALVQQLGSGSSPPSTMTADTGSVWSRLFRKPRIDDGPARGFSDLCVKLADTGVFSGWNVAANGTIIEQQQILTTQNLAAVFNALNMRELLGPALPELVRGCFRWICHRQQMPLAEHHARLVMLKNTAYAWRQMIFYLSFLGAGEQKRLAEWMGAHLSQQSVEFRVRFQPAFDGLLAVLAGNDVTATGGRRFLGWAVREHWLMPGAGQTRHQFSS